MHSLFNRESSQRIHLSVDFPAPTSNDRWSRAAGALQTRLRSLHRLRTCPSTCRCARVDERAHTLPFEKAVRRVDQLLLAGTVQGRRRSWKLNTMYLFSFSDYGEDIILELKFTRSCACTVPAMVLVCESYTCSCRSKIRSPSANDDVTPRRCNAGHQPAPHTTNARGSAGEYEMRC